MAALSSEVRNELKSVETEIKYEGYLLQQQRAIDRLKKAEQRAIPDWFDYNSVSGLSTEMQETLLKIKPRTLAHASRIPGVTPAAVSLVHVYIEIQAKRRQQAARPLVHLGTPRRRSPKTTSVFAFDDLSCSRVQSNDPVLHPDRKPARAVAVGR